MKWFTLIWKSYNGATQSENSTSEEKIINRIRKEASCERIWNNCITFSFIYTNFELLYRAYVILSRSNPNFISLDLFFLIAAKLEALVTRTYLVAVKSSL
jgi:hypothetical protein